MTRKRIEADEADSLLAEISDSVIRHAYFLGLKPGEWVDVRLEVGEHHVYEFAIATKEAKVLALDDSFAKRRKKR